MSAAQPTARLLVVDDDAAMRQMLESVFRAEGYAVSEAGSAADALALARERDYDVVLSDVKMPGDSGFDLLRELRRVRPRTRVVLMTAFGGVETATDALRAGAFGYAAKPFEPEEVIETVARALESRGFDYLGGQPTRAEVDPPAGEAEPLPPGLVGASAATRQVTQLVQRAASSDSNVLIVGESGTGKDVVARALHTYGKRASRPFVAVDCTAIPEAMLESELFGHERGAFTGATSSKRGLFERAERGTLYFDEVAELGPGLQAKLLRALQDGEVWPVGATTSVRVDVRVVAATSRDLRAEIEAGRFREDLFQRLNVIPIHVPPLRERPEDVPLLVEMFVRRHGGGRPCRFSPEAIERLQACPWRGNARELENLVERLLALGNAEKIEVGDLPLDLVGRGREAAAGPEAAGGGQEALRAALAEAARGGMKLHELSDLYIREVLRFTGGKKGQAARRLGIDRKTLYRRDPTR